MSLDRFKDGTLPGRLLVDVANEPSLFEIKWDRPHIRSTTNMEFPSWRDLYFNVTTVCLKRSPS